VLGDSPEILLVKIPVPSPSLVRLEAVVGVPSVLQHTPRAVIGAPPSNVISPPQVAEVSVREVSCNVLILGTLVTIASFLQLPGRINTTEMAAVSSITVPSNVLFIVFMLNKYKVVDVLFFVPDAPHGIAGTNLKRDSWVCLDAVICEPEGIRSLLAKGRARPPGRQGIDTAKMRVNLPETSSSPVYGPEITAR
jgi:hypothetical protein